jgi:hypothetical protein
MEKVISFEYMKEEEYFEIYLIKKANNITLEDLKIQINGLSDNSNPFKLTIE